MQPCNTVCKCYGFWKHQFGKLLVMKELVSLGWDCLFIELETGLKALLTAFIYSLCTERCRFSVRCPLFNTSKAKLPKKLEKSG